ncbi:hypothetical protein Lal_00033075, partial [Lupinus albus]
DNSNYIPIVGGSSNAPTSQSNSSASRVLPKNPCGNRSDIACKHGIAVDETRKIQCKYCQKVVSGGAYSDEEQPKVVEKRKDNENLFKRKGISTQVTINSMLKGIKEEANQAISRCFYNNAIPFNVARSDEYFEMFELVAKHGPGFKPPSYHGIMVKYLKE